MLTDMQCVNKQTNKPINQQTNQPINQSWARETTQQVMVFTASSAWDKHGARREQTPVVILDLHMCTTAHVHGQTHMHTHMHIHERKLKKK